MPPAQPDPPGLRLERMQAYEGVRREATAMIARESDVDVFEPQRPRRWAKCSGSMSKALLKEAGEAGPGPSHQFCYALADRRRRMRGGGSAAESAPLRMCLWIASLPHALCHRAYGCC
jgi:hypothetical protein